ncbi:MAG: hypothetical protein GF330_04035 [Candidatus Eisenbacteria bacterium]|nr:hypothetical protein [Candidatus Eisenbacteria bacterium]
MRHRDDFRRQAIAGTRVTRMGRRSADSSGDQRSARGERDRRSVRAGRSGTDPARVDRIWILGAAALTFAAAAVLSAMLFGRMPHVQDSIAQLFQARIFAGGRLWAPAPPVPELTDYANMVIAEGRWYSQYPPGHALLLSLGVIAGLPWLINPLLGALSVLVIGLLARELCGRTVARLTVLMAAISPFLLLMSAGFMNHATSLLGISLGLLGYFRLLRTGRPRDGLLAGGGIALALLARPYSAFGALLPIALHAAWRWGCERGRFTRPMMAMGLVAAAGGVLLLLYNWATTGAPLRFGYSVAWGAGFGLGFGQGFPEDPHTLSDGLAYTWDTLRRLNGRLFEWPLTSLWPLVLGLLITLPGCPRNRRWLLASVPLGLLLVYLFYWYHDGNDCFGPRYVYGALGPLLILSAAGLAALGGWVTRLFGGQAPPLRDRNGAHHWTLAIAGGLILLLGVWGGLTRWPALVCASRDVAEADARTSARSAFDCFGPNYWGVSPALGRAVAERIPGRALIFVDTQVARHPNPRMRRTARHLLFGAAFAHQEPQLEQARVVYLHATPPDWHPQTEDPGAEIGAIMRAAAAHFPGRRPYLYRRSFPAPRPLDL